MCHYQEEGETIKASAANNFDVDRPPLSHRLRTHQRWLSLNLRASNHLGEDENQHKLELVEKWQGNEPGLDDSLVLHYNLSTEQQTVTTTLHTDVSVSTVRRMMPEVML